ncbi:hypothetical protein C1I91_00850 [Clostridium manihotivorum]|uniref:Glycosyltransferase 2-like domain-containing protein n=1 Tax=Clostridium manihotivorum TaxID=2320868 RepID=A0A3R5V4Z9_9CLOT|nr:glycosyltransferase [Clostridium manihotivorum]QAA30346.1 hypothetical protein C1I91_00850 [Clostridium manihotivorum]
MSKEVSYSVLIPLYNEELVVSESYRRLKFVMNKTKERCEIIFINDGSKANTRRSFSESKDRPTYIVESTMNYDSANKLH